MGPGPCHILELFERERRKKREGGGKFKVMKKKGKDIRQKEKIKKKSLNFWLISSHKLLLIKLLMSYSILTVQ